MKSLIAALILCLGCPKPVNTIEMQEREETIKKLVDDEDLFEDLPESGEEEDDENL